jgi:hypothetical protein
VRLKDLQNSDALNPEERCANECDRIEGKTSELGTSFHDSWGTSCVSNPEEIRRRDRLLRGVKPFFVQDQALLPKRNVPIEMIDLGYAIDVHNHPMIVVHQDYLLNLRGFCF